MKAGNQWHSLWHLSGRIGQNFVDVTQKVVIQDQD